MSVQLKSERREIQRELDLAIAEQAKIDGIVGALVGSACFHRLVDGLPWFELGRTWSDGEGERSWSWKEPGHQARGEFGSLCRGGLVGQYG